MIVVCHKNNLTESVVLPEGEKFTVGHGESAGKTLKMLASQYPNEILVWCQIDCREALNLDKIKELMHHDKMMLSYSPHKESFIGNRIGYVESSPFIKINKKVSYPTWQMSGLVGVISAKVLNEVGDNITVDSNFEYYLNSLAKILMPLGLFCYSEPQLLMRPISVKQHKISKTKLFRFVRQHYRLRWILLLLLKVLLYEREFLLVSFLAALPYKKKISAGINLDSVQVVSSKKVVEKGCIDVLIPTIGRPEHLYNVLLDLSSQTYLPKKIVIVEQNPVPGSQSELGYLNDRNWPFKVEHYFIRQAGACNSRNIALDKIESEWVFLADDDIRFGVDFLESAIKEISKTGTSAVSLSCLKQNEEKHIVKIHQWGSFGSGCSIVKSENLKDCKFYSGYEFGFGEDNDFGMQLRNKGVDILYLPEPEILHLKAPVGGFRIKPVLQWDNDVIQPKPSPTVMLYKKRHDTKEQLLGYKTVSFFKFYKNHVNRNPISYYRNFQKQWKQSEFWADQLN